MSDAEKRAREEIKRHPNYAGSYVTLGRVLLNEKRAAEAIPVLVQATERAPDNLLAHELLAQALGLEGRAVEALRVHKIVLFLNPQNEKAKRAVQKLESVTASEYSDEVFDFKKPEPKVTLASSLELERSLSLFDALVFRNELTKAQKLLGEMEVSFSGDPEVLSRKKLFAFDTDVDEAADATPLRPDLSREKLILESKIKYLQRILARLEDRSAFQQL